MKKLKLYKYYEKAHGEYNDIEFEIKAESKEEALKELQDKGDYNPDCLHLVYEQS